MAHSGENRIVGSGISIERLSSFDDVRKFLKEAYKVSTFVKGAYHDESFEFSFERSALPLEVAEPGPLIEKAIEIADSRGLGIEEARELFHQLDTARFARGIAFAREAGMTEERFEARTGQDGRQRVQSVFYPAGR